VLINEGTVIAEGSFADLQHQVGNNDSLEKIFASLTSNQVSGQAADELMNAFEKI
jgi:hypothetical protein